MKKILLPVFLLALLAGCGVSRETQRYIRPTDYTSAMVELGTTLTTLDKNVVGGQMPLAEAGAERALQLANDISKFDPQRAAETEDDFVEYSEQTSDLRHGLDRLLFFVQHRRKEDSRDQVLDVMQRYNKLSTAYGPGRQLTPIGRIHDPNRPDAVNKPMAAK